MSEGMIGRGVLAGMIGHPDLGKKGNKIARKYGLGSMELLFALKGVLSDSSYKAILSACEHYEAPPGTAIDRLLHDYARLSEFALFPEEAFSDTEGMSYKARLSPNRFGSMVGQGWGADLGGDSYTAGVECYDDGELKIKRVGPEGLEGLDRHRVMGEKGFSEAYLEDPLVERIRSKLDKHLFKDVALNARAFAILNEEFGATDMMGLLALDCSKVLAAFFGQMKGRAALKYFTNMIECVSRFIAEDDFDKGVFDYMISSKAWNDALKFLRDVKDEDPIFIDIGDLIEGIGVTDMIRKKTGPINKGYSLMSRFSPPPTSLETPMTEVLSKVSQKRVRDAKASFVNPSHEEGDLHEEELPSTMIGGIEIPESVARMLKRRRHLKGTNGTLRHQGSSEPNQEDQDDAKADVQEGEE